MHENGLGPVYGIHHKTGARTGNILSVPHRQEEQEESDHGAQITVSQEDKRGHLQDSKHIAPQRSRPAARQIPSKNPPLRIAL